MHDRIFNPYSTKTGFPSGATGQTGQRKRQPDT